MGGAKAVGKIVMPLSEKDEKENGRRKGAVGRKWRINDLVAQSFGREWSVAHRRFGSNQNSWAGAGDR